MNRVIGFMLFWIGFGILIGLQLSDAVCCVLISAACLLLGYLLFCRD